MLAALVHRAAVGVTEVSCFQLLRQKYPSENCGQDSYFCPLGSQRHSRGGDGDFSHHAECR